MTIHATVTIELLVVVSGKMCPAEPDVGIFERYFEDIVVGVPDIGLFSRQINEYVLKNHEEELQQALTEESYEQD